MGFLTFLWQRMRVLPRSIKARLGFLVNVGLDYLTLDRAAGTLSGGEAQRIRLATQIGSGLVGVLYILDEPSIGLHPRDNARLLDTLKKLRDLGNTLIDPEAVQGFLLPKEEIHLLREKLAAMSPAERMQLPGLHPGRADVIVAGAAILQVIVDGLDCEKIMVSDADPSFSIIPPFRAGLLFLQKLFGLFFQDAVIFQAVEGLKVFQGNFGQFSITSVGGPP